MPAARGSALGCWHLLRANFVYVSHYSCVFYVLFSEPGGYRQEVHQPPPPQQAYRQPEPAQPPPQQYRQPQPPPPPSQPVPAKASVSCDFCTTMLHSSSCLMSLWDPSVSKSNSALWYIALCLDFCTLWSI